MSANHTHTQNSYCCACVVASLCDGCHSRSQSSHSVRWIQQGAS